MCNGYTSIYLMELRRVQSDAMEMIASDIFVYSGFTVVLEPSSKYLPLTLYWKV